MRGQGSHAIGDVFSLHTLPPGQWDPAMMCLIHLLFAVLLTGFPWLFLSCPVFCPLLTPSDLFWDRPSGLWEGILRTVFSPDLK